MLASPTWFAVTFPFSSTEATNTLSDDHVASSLAVSTAVSVADKFTSLLLMPKELEPLEEHEQNTNGSAINSKNIFFITCVINLFGIRVVFPSLSSFGKGEMQICTESAQQ
jgi:hypothetical protein